VKRKGPLFNPETFADLPLAKRTALPITPSAAPFTTRAWSLSSCSDAWHSHARRSAAPARWLMFRARYFLLHAIRIQSWAAPLVMLICAPLVSAQPAAREGSQASSNVRCRTDYFVWPE
jgi:hypothetical protein